MIVEYRWRSDGDCRAHPGRHCFFQWVPSVEQAELLDGIEDFSYLDRVVSVSGLVEVEEELVPDRIPPQFQLSFLTEVS